MKIRLAGAALALALASAAGAQTIQQQFDQSSSALAEGRWEEALRGFEALEPRLAKQPESLAVVRVRKGEALAQLGRDEAARAALQQGLPALPASAPNLREDRLLGHLALGQIAERALDYGEALKHYRAAEPLAENPVDKARALRGIVQTGMFFDGRGALADADRVIALVSRSAPDNKALIAQLRALKGRALLNLKRYQEAGEELGWATRALGGLSLKVDAADLTARSDMALAQLLLGRHEEARKYLAYTGAGRLKQELQFGAQMTPPACGEEGLRPDDVAVVEFSIRSDGSIGHVSPVYASREGSSALAFARAVRSWSWKPDEVKEVPPLLRALTRVELRCTTAVERPDPFDLLKADALAALGPQGALPSGEGISEAVRLRTLTAELATRERQAGAAAPALLPVLIELADNAVLPNEERAAHARRALEIARASAAAPAVLSYLRLQTHSLDHWARNSSRYRPVDWTPLQADPLIQAAPRTAAAVRLLHAEALAQEEKREQAKPILQQVVSAPGTSAADPLKVAALLRLSSLELATGNAEAARASFAATGLTAQQCALIDPGPVKDAGNPSSNDFPDEALRWGFEGFAQIEYDITPEGRVTAARPIAAYPPFTFGKAAADMIGRYRYDPTYRPGGSIGCGGKTARINFRMAD
jgi:tetratricopeptide (TPR) repeat protein